MIVYSAIATSIAQSALPELNASRCGGLKRAIHFKTLI